MFFVAVILLLAGYAAAVWSALGHPIWILPVAPLTVAGIVAFWVDCRELRFLRRIGGTGVFTMSFGMAAAATMWLVVNLDLAPAAMPFVIGYVALTAVATVAAAIGTIAVLLDV